MKCCKLMQLVRLSHIQSQMQGLMQNIGKSPLQQANLITDMSILKHKTQEIQASAISRWHLSA